MKVLIQELNKLLAENKEGTDITKLLSKESLNCFNFLPKEIQNQLLLDRDPHGNVKVSQIETEKLLIELVKKELKKRDFKGKFSALNHFLGYEGRAGMPSNFDAQYCYSLGYVAALLINEGLSGYMSALANLKSPIEKWIPKGIPLTSMMNIEERDGKKKPVIKKALVELNGNSYKLLKENNLSWQFEDSYIYPGPIQYFGEKELTDEIPMLLRI